jgi:ubiquitin-protein ligase
MITLDDVILERKNSYTYVKLKNSIFIIKKNNIVLKNDNNNYWWLYKVNYNSILNKYSEEKLINNLIVLYNKYELCKNIKKNEIFFKKKEHKLEQLIYNSFDLIENKLFFGQENSNVEELVYNSFSFTKDEIFKRSLVRMRIRKNIAEIIQLEYMNIYIKYNENIQIKFIENDTFNWEISIFNTFNKKILKFSEKETKLIINIKINPYKYPFNPPVIELLSPTFDNNLNYRINNSKYTKKNYWNCNKTINDVIQRTISIVNKYGIIQNNIINQDDHYLNILISEIKEKITNISNYIDYDDVIDQDCIYIRSNNNSSGTGYSNETTKYNPDTNESKSHKNSSNKNLFIKNINNLIDKINEYLEINFYNLSQLIPIFKNSILMNYIIKILKESSLITISYDDNYYSAMLNLILLFCNVSSIDLFYNNKKELSLFHIIENLYKQSLESVEIDNSNETSNIIICIYNMIKDIYQVYLIENNIVIEQNKKRINNNYVNSMKKYKFKFTDDSFNNYEFKDFVNESNNMKTCYKRLSNEIPNLKEMLPFNNDNIFILRINKNKPNVMRLMFPNVAPEIRLLNHHNRTLNPNFYSNGKICLSLLSTYVGSKPHESELWNPSISSLYQVIMSILGQILVKEPYFNEEANIRYLNTIVGKRYSEDYTNNTKYNVMKSCIIDVIDNVHRYPEFKDAILTHFYLKKNNIIESYENWHSNLDKNIRKMFNFFELQNVLNLNN